MAALIFVTTGLGFALLAAVLGTAVVALVEIVIALLDPKRAPEIRERSWRQNLRHMLH